MGRAIAAPRFRLIRVGDGDDPMTHCHNGSGPPAENFPKGSMPTDLAIRCVCGAVAGIARAISGRRGNRLVCYCGDCQSFAHFLGGTDCILDAQGGTEIYQTSPARLQITAGTDRLACMRLSPDGLLRWYAGCCRTPIGNTLAIRQVPFVGLIHCCLHFESTGRSRDEVLGPVHARIFTRFARGDLARRGGHGLGSARLILRSVPMLLAARLRGDHARSPFFAPETGDPIALPHVLCAEELARVEAARDRASLGVDRART